MENTFNDGVTVITFNGAHYTYYEQNAIVVLCTLTFGVYISKYTNHVLWLGCLTPTRKVLGSVSDVCPYL